eukprot:scaffold154321_cov49-Attheya_sp.AAC.1
MAFATKWGETYFSGEMVAELAKLTISVGLLRKLRVLCLWRWRRGGGNVGSGRSFAVVVGVGPRGRWTIWGADRVAEKFSAATLLACFPRFTGGVDGCLVNRTLGGDTVGFPPWESPWRLSPPTAGSDSLDLMGTLGSAAASNGAVGTGTVGGEGGSSAVA